MNLSMLYRRSVDQRLTFRQMVVTGVLREVDSTSKRGGRQKAAHNPQCNQLSWKRNLHKQVYNKPGHRPLSNPEA